MEKWRLERISDNNWYLKDRLVHYKLDYNNKQFIFMSRLLFAELLTRYAKAKNMTLHATAVAVASRIADIEGSQCAIEIQDFDLRTSTYFSREHAIKFYMQYGLNSILDNHNENKFEPNTLETSENFIKPDIYWAIHFNVQTAFKSHNPLKIKRSILDWMDENNVPDINQIEYGKNSYTVPEIASINRFIEYNASILSKKSIRKKLKVNPDYMDEISFKMR